ncbi:MAG: hypothetical protein RL095_3119 [Verrucomicrobiota bacterium]|jgi:hypothetical protein
MIAASLVAAWLSLTPDEIDRVNEQFRLIEARTEATISVPQGKPAVAAAGHPVRLIVRLKNGGDAPLKFDAGMLRILRDGLGGGKELELKPLFERDDSSLRARLEARQNLLERLKVISDDESGEFLLLNFPQLPRAERSRERARMWLEKEIEALSTDLKTLAAWKSTGSIPAGGCLELAFKSSLPPGFDQNVAECRLTLRLNAPTGLILNLPAEAKVE